MKVSVVRPHLGDDGRVIDVGSVMEVSLARAKDLEARNIAVPIVGHLGKEAASKGAERPTQARRNGGQTGAAKPVLLSPPAPALRRPVLSLPKVKRGR